LATENENFGRSNFRLPQYLPHPIEKFIWALSASVHDIVQTLDSFGKGVCGLWHGHELSQTSNPISEGVKPPWPPWLPCHLVDTLMIRRLFRGIAPTAYRWAIIGSVARHSSNSTHESCRRK